MEHLIVCYLFELETKGKVEEINEAEAMSEWQDMQPKPNSRPQDLPTDGMTADYYLFSHEFLGRTSTRIINEVRGINRVVYDIT